MVPPCADNYRPSTGLSEFINAIHVHGLPERVCTDLGGENVEGWRNMVEQRSLLLILAHLSTMSALTLVV